MKFRVILLAILLLFIGLYGWRFYYDSVTSYQAIKQYEVSSDAILEDIEKLKSGIDDEIEYKAPTCDGLYDFCNDIVDAGYPITKCIGKKIIGNATSNVASCTDLNELHNFKYVDILQVVLEVEDKTAFIKYLEEENIWVDRLTYYPSDNVMVLDIIVTGGGELW